MLSPMEAMRATFVTYDASVLPPEFLHQYGICCTELQLLEMALKQALRKDVLAFEQTQNRVDIFEFFKTMTLGQAHVQAMGKAGSKNVNTHFYETCFVNVWQLHGFKKEKIASDFEKLVARRNNVAHALLFEVVTGKKTIEKATNSLKKAAQQACTFREVLVVADNLSTQLGSVNTDGTSSARARETLPKKPNRL